MPLESGSTTGRQSPDREYLELLLTRVLHCVEHNDSTGFVAADCSPTQRGFDTFLGYYTACLADYWTHSSPLALGTCDDPMGVDFSHNYGNHIGPADSSLNGTYDAHVFRNQATKHIAEHDPSQGPMYMYLAPQNVHLACGPNKKTDGIQAPCNSIDQFPHIGLDQWKGQAAMLLELDFLVGNVTNSLKSHGLWNNTIIAFVSDNGGPLDRAYWLPCTARACVQ